ncbi:hypothetical protein NpNSSI1_00000992 [Neofusicoccum parvum]|nr:hypothetical protein NpNSSI1_00000992 [Neofusicoccum parvum]
MLQHKQADQAPDYARKFTQSICKLASAQSITITGQDLEDDSHPIWGVVRRSIGLEPTDWKWRRPGGSHGKLFDYENQRREGQLQLSLLLPALDSPSSACKPTSLSFKGTSSTFLLPTSTSSRTTTTATDAHLPRIPPLANPHNTALHPLTTLTIAITYDTTSPPTHLRSLSTRLAALLLTSTPSLHTLDLTHVPDPPPTPSSSSPPPPTPSTTRAADILAALLPSASDSRRRNAKQPPSFLPHLHTLRLSTVTTATALAALLTRLAPRLHVLDLAFVVLAPECGTWEDVFAALRHDGGGRALRTLRLGTLMDYHADGVPAGLRWCVQGVARVVVLGGAKGGWDERLRSGIEAFVRGESDVCPVLGGARRRGVGDGLVGGWGGGI